MTEFLFFAIAVVVVACGLYTSYQVGRASAPSRYPENHRLTALFLAVAEQPELKVTLTEHDYSRAMRVSCALGTLVYHVNTDPGETAQSGEFVAAGQEEKEAWRNEQPSRDAIRRLTRAANDRRFKLGGQP
jgi:hypothetical protein